MGRSLFVALAAEDVGALVDFYRQVLGEGPSLTQPHYAEFRGLGLRLAIFRPRPDHRAEFGGGGGGAMSLCLEVGDLAGAIARLRALGYGPPGAIITAPHGDEIYAYDPVGTRLILYQPKSPDLPPQP